MTVDYPITKPHAIDEWARAALTISCRDCDIILKHPQAGQVEIDADGKKWQTMHNGLLVEYGGYYGEWMASIISALRGHRSQASWCCPAGTLRAEIFARGSLESNCGGQSREGNAKVK